MLKLLIKKEILENIFSFKFLIMFLLVFLLVNTSIFIMTKEYRARLQNYDLLRPSDKEAFAITYPAPLSIFAYGLDHRICNLYQISFDGQIETGSQKQAINKIYNFFNTPDLLYIISIILSFCAILFASDLISREKEQGTLKLIFSNGIKRPLFSLGKWTGGYITIIIPIVLSVLCGLVFFVLLAEVPFQSTDFIRLLIFLFFTFVYLAGFFSIGFISRSFHGTLPFLCSSHSLYGFRWFLLSPDRVTFWPGNLSGSQMNNNLQHTTINHQLTNIFKCYKLLI